MLTVSRNANSWHLILADLALILFLVTAAALSAGSGSQANDGETISGEAISGEAKPPATPPPSNPVAPSQALYRADPGLPTLAQWLADQPRDPRAALTIVAQHAPGEEDSAWSDARAMAATASAMGVRARVIIREGDASDLHASLGYDQPEL